MAPDVTSDELDPPWWRQPKARGRRRAPLSRATIVDAALAILDADGVDALTIRRLGHELGTGSASLYWHIAGKDELCELVYDRIMGEIELPDPDPSRWEDQLKDLARQAYRAMLSHNDAVRLSIGRPPAGPNTLRIVEWMLALMRGAGIPDEPTVYFGNILGRYLDASVLEVTMAVSARDAEATQDRAAEMMREYWARLPADRFPNLTALADMTFAGDADAVFEFGLDLLMRGLAAYRDRSASNPR
ncbi:MAG: TetR/AcrR family transcriptional regulator [Acidimicrobiia bacterium]